MADDAVYICHYFAESTPITWETLPLVELAETVTKEKPRMETMVSACWTDKGVHFRFVCEDDYEKCSYSKRDDPLYEQDVVEIFIDQTGTGRNYIELELSPANVVFDALIENDLQGHIKINSTWNALDMLTSVEQTASEQKEYHFFLPRELFYPAPAKGVCWRINLYRIDENEHGKREFSAWRPTGKYNFHIPAAFGRFEFAD